MSSTKELYKEFKRLWSQFEENHISFEEKGNNLRETFLEDSPKEPGAKNG